MSISEQTECRGIHRNMTEQEIFFVVRRLIWLLIRVRMDTNCSEHCCPSIRAEAQSRTHSMPPACTRHSPLLPGPFNASATRAHRRYADIHRRATADQTRVPPARRDAVLRTHQSLKTCFPAFSTRLHVMRSGSCDRVCGAHFFTPLHQTRRTRQLHGRDFRMRMACT